MRGVLYYIASYKSMTSNFKYLSITNNKTLRNNKKLSIKQTEDAQEYIDNNKIAGKTYIYFGLFLFFVYLIISIVFSSFFNNYYIIFTCIIIFIDYLLNIIIAIKFKLNEWDKINLINEKEHTR